MSRIADKPFDYDMGAPEDFCVLVMGLECGRMAEAELIASSNNKHEPGRDVAWLELKRRAMLKEDTNRFQELENEQ